MTENTSWLTLQETADALDISERTIQRRIADGQLNPVLRGNKKRYYFAANEVAQLKSPKGIA